MLVGEKYREILFTKRSVNDSRQSERGSALSARKEGRVGMESRYPWNMGSGWAGKKW